MLVEKDGQALDSDFMRGKKRVIGTTIVVCQLQNGSRVLSDTSWQASVVSLAI